MSHDSEIRCELRRSFPLAIMARNVPANLMEAAKQGQLGRIHGSTVYRASAQARVAAWKERLGTMYDDYVESRLHCLLSSQAYYRGTSLVDLVDLGALGAKSAIEQLVNDHEVAAFTCDSINFSDVPLEDAVVLIEILVSGYSKPRPGQEEGGIVMQPIADIAWWAIGELEELAKILS